MQLDLQPLRVLRVITRDVEGDASMAAGKGGSSSVPTTGFQASMPRVRKRSFIGRAVAGWRG